MTDSGQNIVDSCGRGTVRYIPIEGGFYGIEGDDAVNYDPVNLPHEFQKEGLRIEFVYREGDDLITFHMWGKVIEILSVKEIK